MASASALPPWVVLDRNVEDADLVDMSDHKWATVKCSRREAYGCGEFGQALVEGLTLYVRLGDGRNDRFSALVVRATDEALRRIAPPTNPGISLFPGHPRTTAPRITFTVYLNGAEENLVVLTAAFNSGCNVYYLLYDNIDESLIMIPSLTPPYSWFDAFPTQPILRRCSTGGYDLAVLGRGLRSSGEFQEVLGLWPMKGRPCSGQWMLKDLRLPKGNRGYFRPDVVFSFKGKTFCADLKQGFMCWDTTDLIGGDSVEDFRYVSLPQEYLLPVKYNELGPMEMYRTMGKSGDSIKFVSINSACTAAAAGQATEGPWHTTTAAGKATVAVWTLDQAGLGWKKDVEFSLKSLWAKRGFKASRLPKEVPVWPFLRPQEDGALYFLVPKPLMKPEDPQLYHICGVDMRSKKILLSGLLTDHFPITQPVTLPANAFAFQHL